MGGIGAGSEIIMEWQCYVTKEIVQQHSNDQMTPKLSVLGMRNAPDVAHAPLGIFGNP